MSYHEPVLLRESVEAMVLNKDGIYIDCTFGGGGHAKLILEKLSEKGRLIGFDQDDDASNNVIKDDRLQLVKQNFRYIKKQLRFIGITKVDGILVDLGVSSHQINEPERGFSIRFDARLDMRMNQSQELDAHHIINKYEESELIYILKEYGEIPYARKVATTIINAREQGSINTTKQLTGILNGFVSRNNIKFLAQVFQAIRIAVNDEINALKDLITQSTDIINEGGRFVAISYHSLEDRLVKRYIRSGLFKGEPEKDIFGNWKAPFKPLQTKVIKPTEEEIVINSRARSAKMRVGIKNEW